MAKRNAAGSAVTVGRVAAGCQRLAPVELAQDWDNVGLLAGDAEAGVQRALTCVDLTAAVATEAVARKCQMVVTYHPPIFKPIDRLTADAGRAEAAVFHCIAHGVAVYALHTALDAADAGTNDVLAALCGAKATEPLMYADAPGDAELKLVTFVPAEAVSTVAEAVFEAGAGRIGDYTQCSYRLAGHGTFFGGEGTNPAVGARGRMEIVDEVRLETVVPARALPAVVEALRRAHPYEEPAFDIFPRQAPPTRGIGRVGTLPEPIALQKLARKLKRATPATSVQLVGSPDGEVQRVIVVVGAAGSLPFQAGLHPGDAVITGEIRHHDALAIARRGAAAIALGHWASERPVLSSLATRLQSAVPGLTVLVSAADADPFLPA